MGDLSNALSIPYQEGYVKALRDVLAAYAAAKGVRTRRQSIAWLTCLTSDPERLMHGFDVSMVLTGAGKTIRYDFEDNHRQPKRAGRR